MGSIVMARLKQILAQKNVNSDFKFTFIVAMYTHNVHTGRSAFIYCN